MKGVPVRQTLGNRRLSPVKYMKRKRRMVARTLEDLQRIEANAAVELATKQWVEANCYRTH